MWTFQEEIICLFVETSGFSKYSSIDYESESVEAIRTKVLMIKLRNSNTYIPQYETWAGANDGLVAEAAQQHCSELQHRKSLPVAGHWTWNHTNTKRLHTTFPTVPYCTQCSAGSWPTLEFSHNAAGSRAGAELGWSHPFIAFFPVVLNI